MRRAALLSLALLAGCASERYPDGIEVWGHELAHVVHGSWHAPSRGGLLGRHKPERRAGPGAMGAPAIIRVLETHDAHQACLAAGMKALPHDGRYRGCSLSRRWPPPGYTLLIVPALFSEAP